MGSMAWRSIAVQWCRDLKTRRSGSQGGAGGAGGPFLKGGLGTGEFANDGKIYLQSGASEQATGRDVL